MVFNLAKMECSPTHLHKPYLKNLFERSYGCSKAKVKKTKKSQNHQNQSQFNVIKVRRRVMRIERKQNCLEMAQIG